jgi:putative hemolysin
VEEKIDQLVQDRAPWLVNGSFLSKTIYTFLKKFLKFSETIYVGDHIQGMSGAEAFNWLGSEYTSNCEIEGLENIPKDGKCLLVANHPMGAADAVSLYHQIFKVREDVFFFANELFVYLLGSFKDVMAPVVWNKEKEIHSATKVTLERLNTFFGDERIGIIFPSGRLSKLTLLGIWDRPWEKTPITLAKKYNFPVIPVYIDAKNSWFFYFASYANKQLRDVSQLNELLNKKEYKFTIKIGKPIKHTDLSSHNDIAIQQLRYKSESLKKGFFKLKRFLYLRQYKN